MIGFRENCVNGRTNERTGLNLQDPGWLLRWSKNKNVDFSSFTPGNDQKWSFHENSGSVTSFISEPLTCCKISEKINKQIPRKLTDKRTDGTEFIGPCRLHWGSNNELIMRKLSYEQTTDGSEFIGTCLLCYSMHGVVPLLQLTPLLVDPHFFNGSTPLFSGIFQKLSKWCFW